MEKNEGMTKNEGMLKNIAEIREFIEEKLKSGYRKFIIFPYGDIGITVKHFLNSAYGIQEAYILDNHLCQYNKNIQPLAYMANVENREDFAVLLSSNNPYIYKELWESLLAYFEPKQIAEFTSMKRKKVHTKIGKYSYGPICHDHFLIESIGSFCSFGIGVEAVRNHEMRFVTTHPMIYAGQMDENMEVPFSTFDDFAWYFEGVQPHEEVMKSKRSKIGNDVWLGQNVLITNGADIGNGVIAGAGAVITKAVPDYAVVVGVPAKIIKYRYSPEQIEKLNGIAWWNWTDEEIRERYDDFYLPIDEFIRKHL